MSMQFCTALSGYCIPHPYRFIPACGDDKGAIRAERGVINRCSVSFELEQEERAAAGDIPNPRRIVVRAHYHPFAVRAKRCVGDNVLFLYLDAHMGFHQGLPQDVHSVISLLDVDRLYCHKEA